MFIHVYVFIYVFIYRKQSQGTLRASRGLRKPFASETTGGKMFLEHAAGLRGCSTDPSQASLTPPVEKSGLAAWGFVFQTGYKHIYIYIYIHGCTNLPEAIPTRTQ